MLNQFKMAADMLKNMSPEERAGLMEQAKNSNKMLEDAVRKILEEEIEKRGLITKEDVEKMLREYNG